jgi:hypothetical protein
VGGGFDDPPELGGSAARNWLTYDQRLCLLRNTERTSGDGNSATHSAEPNGQDNSNVHSVEQGGFGEIDRSN